MASKAQANEFNAFIVCLHIFVSFGTGSSATRSFASQESIRTISRNAPFTLHHLVVCGFGMPEKKN